MKRFCAELNIEQNCWLRFGGKNRANKNNRTSGDAIGRKHEIDKTILTQSSEI